MKYLKTFLLLITVFCFTSTTYAKVISERNEKQNYVSIETDNEIQAVANNPSVFSKFDGEKVYHFKDKKPGNKPDTVLSLSLYIESPNPIYVRELKILSKQKNKESLNIKFNNPLLVEQKMTGNGKVYWIDILLPNNAIIAMASGNYEVKDVIKKQKNYKIYFDLMDNTGKIIKGEYVVGENAAKDICYAIMHDIYSDPEWVNKIPSFY